MKPKSTEKSQKHNKRVHLSDIFSACRRMSARFFTSKHIYFVYKCLSGLWGYSSLWLWVQVRFFCNNYLLQNRKIYPRERSSHCFQLIEFDRSSKLKMVRRCVLFPFYLPTYNSQAHKNTLVASTIQTWKNFQCRTQFRLYQLHSVKRNAQVWQLLC
jgi:hypothetical protein